MRVTRGSILDAIQHLAPTSFNRCAKALLGQQTTNWLEMAGQMDGGASYLNGWKRMDDWMD